MLLIAIYRHRMQLDKFEKKVKMIKSLLCVQFTSEYAFRRRKSGTLLFNRRKNSRSLVAKLFNTNYKDLCRKLCGLIMIIIITLYSTEKIIDKIRTSNFSLFSFSLKYKFHDKFKCICICKFIPLNHTNMLVKGKNNQWCNSRESQ